MILEKIKNIFFGKNNNSGDLIVKSPLFVVKDNKITINGDLDIIVKGNLRILSDGHTVLQTSKNPSNDEFEIYSLHLNPEQHNSVYIRGNKNE